MRIRMWVRMRISPSRDVRKDASKSRVTNEAARVCSQDKGTSRDKDTGKGKGKDVRVRTRVRVCVFFWFLVCVTFFVFWILEVVKNSVELNRLL